MNKKNQGVIDANIKFLKEFKDENLTDKTKAILDFQKSKIDKLLAIQKKEKRNLVFIGDSSAGKTTIISSLLDLYIDKKGYAIQAMPSDAGGRTTPCLTEILLDSEKYFIKVENETRERVEDLLICYLQQNSKEVERNLPEEYITIFDQKIPEDIRTICEEMESEDINLERIKLLNLNLETNDLYKEFDYDANKDDVLVSLNKLLLQIKKGKHSDIFIPKKITIGLKNNTTILTKNIQKIIDTRGISTDSSGETLFCREDLEKYIKDEENIIVYINKYPSLNRRIQKTFKKFSQNDEVYKGILDRLIILVNTQDVEVISKMNKSKIVNGDDELEEEIECIGNIYEMMDGFGKEIVLKEFYNTINKKADSFTSILNQYKVPNLLIYRPFAGKKKELKKIYVESKNDSLEEKKRFNNIFDNIVKQESENIQEKLLESTDLAVSIIKNKVGTDEVIKKALSNFPLRKI